MVLIALRSQAAVLAGRRGESKRERRDDARRPSEKKLNLPIHPSSGFAASVNYLKSGAPPGSDDTALTPAWVADLAHTPATAFELRRRAAASGDAFPKEEVTVG